ncbi:MAG: diacylglycerol kinase family lipid kinase [Acidobacteriaceae bacterium]|nr:diacylglycerol kinase family lipid kinase [Acidobacteriaceae bacterium]
MAIYSKAFLIFNPYAGQIRRRKSALDEAVAGMRKAGHFVQTMPTTGPGTASELARQCLDRGADLILVAGGDGTINEVVNGMVYSQVPLGVIPGGTANVLAVETGIGTRMRKASQSLASWIPERVSLGLHCSPGGPSRHFLLMCGAGLDAQIVYNISASLKAAIGKISYWIAGFSQLGRRFPEFELEAEGQRYRVSFALASRVRNYGGDLEIARQVTLMDDCFELVLFQGSSSFKYLRYMAGVVSRHLDNVPGVTILQTRAVRMYAPEDRRIYSQIDGERAGHLPVNLEVVPRSLTLLLPQTYRTRRSVAVPQQEWTTSHTP